MSTTHDARPSEGEVRASLMYGRPPGRIRWTVDQYTRMAELGFFRNRRVELLEGEIYELSPANPPHAISIVLGNGVLMDAFRPDYHLRTQLPLDLGRRTQPEPDFAVILGLARTFVQHPRTAALVVEVSDSSLRYDRTLKAHLYARAGIADYWIVNLNDRQLEVHRNPGPNPSRKGRFLYREIATIPADGHVSPLAKPEGRIAVADFLP